MMKPPQKSRVLIADHDHTFLDQLADRLLRMDMEVDFAENGRTAIQLVESEAYDLVITEIAMPIYNGLEILRRAKERNSSTPILITSFSATTDWAEQAVREGAHTYLLRPLNDLKEFDRAVKEALHNQHAPQENTFFHQTFSNVALDETLSTSADIPMPTWELDHDLAPSAMDRDLYSPKSLKSVGSIHKEGASLYLRDQEKRSENQVLIPEGAIEFNSQGQILSCDRSARNWLTLESNAPDRPIRRYIRALGDPSTPANVEVQVNGRYAQILMNRIKDRMGSERIILRIREIQNRASALTDIPMERNAFPIGQQKAKAESAVVFNSNLKRFNPNTLDQGWSPLMFIDQMKKSIKNEVEKLKENNPFHIFEPQTEEADPEVMMTISQRLSDISRGRRTSYQ
ncbi:MAG: hypothetical protein A2Z14_05110 [Chloroflexi bacterium RBG_16_48_8]|nr:MAG: hypothetical protein A2Z14_05110 [Chloroflexi bacterium RBG_16_48_8]